MKITPIFRVTDMKAAVSFYTKILDFTLKYPDTDEDWVVDLVNGDGELQLTKGSGDQKAAINANVYVDDVDSLFANTRSGAWILHIKKNHRCTRGQSIKHGACANFM